MTDFRPDFDGEGRTNYSTALPSHLCTPSYASTACFHPDTGSCQPDTSAPWSLNATNHMADLVDHSADFPMWQTPAQCGDAPGLQGARPVYLDPLANGVDVVNTAFLLLVQFLGYWRLDKSLDRLTLLLREGYIPQNELLALVNWEGLQNVGETSASRVVDTASRLAPPGHSKPNEPPCSSTLNTTTPPCNFSGLDVSTHSAGYSPQPDTALYFPEYPLYDAPTDSVAQSSTTQTPSSLSSALLTPRPDSPFLPAVQREEPEVRPSEHQQSVSQTPHAGAIVDSAVPVKRRCRDCGVDKTKQWRTHPEFPGSLCNACGQHQSKHGAPRSLQVMKRAWAKANNHNHVGTLSASPSPLPEKRGGDVIMRVDPTKLEQYN
ncbi:hypothetical protein MSAN_01730500 [Mycena sanguinolenta]|uniref:GATA-type domain-containing protein n=1 Tax=Mycena sanguinolenta TaxID=230812 RepID=A0A8H7CVD9_9AGAR|nr:hypothetical protein MSAN_01730500 [Mycena sanguinolenta]